jgi:hypothetical protein
VDAARRVKMAEIKENLVSSWARDTVSAAENQQIGRRLG